MDPGHARSSRSSSCMYRHVYTVVASAWPRCHVASHASNASNTRVWSSSDRSRGARPSAMSAASDFIGGSPAGGAMPTSIRVQDLQRVHGVVQLEIRGVHHLAAAHHPARRTKRVIDRNPAVVVRIAPDRTPDRTRHRLR